MQASVNKTDYTKASIEVIRLDDSVKDLKQNASVNKSVHFAVTDIHTICTFIYVCIHSASSESLGCMVNIQGVLAAEALYPPRYAEWASVEQSRARLISPQAMAARPLVGG